jgi:hypothetical protein
MVLGSGVMALLSRFAPAPDGLPDWQDFHATTLGDTVLLPALLATLVAGIQHFRVRGLKPSRKAFWTAAVIALLGAAAQQATWLLDPSPRLTWVLPEAHRFSAAGWYHAGFLCVVAAAVAGAAACVVGQMIHVRRTGNEAVLRDSATQTGTFVVLHMAWLFGWLIVLDGGAGISAVTTSISAIAPGVLSLLLALWVLRAGAVPPVQCAAITTLAAAVLVVTPRTTLFWVTVALAVTAAAGVCMRDDFWRRRSVEWYALTLLLAGVVVTAMRPSQSLPVTLFVVFAGAATAVWVVPATSQFWDPQPEKPDSRTVMVVAVLTSSIPVAAWLFPQPQAHQAYGNVITLAYSAIFGPQLVPVIKNDFKTLLKQEREDAAITDNPVLSALALRISLRTALWGSASIIGMITVAVSAGPSMGFKDGTGAPHIAVPTGVVIGVLMVLTAALPIVRSYSWAPAALCGVAVAMGSTSTVEILTGPRPGGSLMLLILVGLVVLWQVESIVANAAMRPSWLVRRTWRQAAGLCLAFGVSANFALAVMWGVTNDSGKQASLLGALALMLAAGLVNLVLILTAGRVLDPSSDAPATIPTATEANWARYRMRSSILQDYGLVFLLVVFGFWLPFQSLSRSNLDSGVELVGPIVLACTGMLFYSSAFFMAVRNSVQHIAEQSAKAGRPHRAMFFNSLPVVSPAEEAATLRMMFTKSTGPATQREWASVLAVHQLHLNVLAMLLTVVSVLGALPFSNNVRDDA